MATAKRPTVTEHAVVRYLERVRGIDIQEVRREILAGVTGAAVKKQTSCVVKRGDGVSFVVRAGVVVTVKKT